MALQGCGAARPRLDGPIFGPHQCRRASAASHGRVVLKERLLHTHLLTRRKRPHLGARAVRHGPIANAGPSVPSGVRPPGQEAFPLRRLPRPVLLRLATTRTKPSSATGIRPAKLGRGTNHQARLRPVEGASLELDEAKKEPVGWEAGRSCDGGLLDTRADTQHTARGTG